MNLMWSAAARRRFLHGQHYSGDSSPQSTQSARNVSASRFNELRLQIMYVGVAVFEIHLPLARSLKEKRGVVRSIRDRLRARHELSVAEVALQDLHQRARLAVAMVSGDRLLIERAFGTARDLVETNGECEILGWNEDYIQYDDDAPLEISAMSGEGGTE